MSEYNGHENYETWDASLWILNDYGLYTAALDFMRHVDPPTDSSPYQSFIDYMDMTDEYTPDHTPWISPVLDYADLNEMMFDLLN